MACPPPRGVNVGEESAFRNRYAEPPAADKLMRQMGDRRALFRLRRQNGCGPGRRPAGGAWRL